ncbi:MAG: autoinducer 2 ABC transporter substrate-binding protein [Verrucomicrobia bacterium]|nr:autoinducer 2 ABC transporter substrate-binding protein [Verrucomicrobiota bacterium]MBV9276149.1 autoinducer 2 ABC transporter substrate-binding protein [Verrucomicrobiota bacterium]
MKLKFPNPKLGFSTFTLLLTLALTGLPAAAPAQKKYTIAFVPKLINIGYFNAMLDGGNKAAKDLGVTFDYEGPTTADASLQVQTIKQLIAKHVDAIAVAPDDPAVVAPALQQAEAQGIKTFTTDTDAPGTVRRVFVNQALDTEIGEATIDALADAMGKQGDWAIDSCGPAAQNLNAWIAIEKERAAKMYPNMHLVTVVYSGEDIAKAVADSKDLITGHPNLKGIIGQCSTSAPGAAKAVTDLNAVGKVFVTGITVPSLMKQYVDNGAVKSFVLWNPVNLGYLTVWAGLQLCQGKSFQAVNSVPTIGDVRYDASKKMLILGPPTVFDKSNIGQFNF